MPIWQTEAQKLFPDLTGRYDSMYQLWIELHILFDHAYETGDAELIKRIYHFSHWCCAQPRGTDADDDLLTAVTVSFFEHIPENDMALKDMPRWWSRKQVEEMRDVFSYMVGPEGYARILDQYDG